MRFKIAVLGTWALGILVMCSGCSTGPTTEQIEQQNMAIIRKAHADLQRGDVES